MFNGIPFSVGAMKIKTLPLVVGAAVLLAGTSTTVIAQELRRGASVLDRPKPELDPLGVRAGSFLIFPKVEVGTAYDDNVFATPAPTTASSPRVGGVSVRVLTGLLRCSVID